MDKRLGKGLGALISESQSEVKKKVDKIRVTDIVPNPFQPRKKFTEKRMEDLMNSLKEKGVIQPILVRPSGKLYELIAGERRWRAAQELNMEEIPAIIREDIDDANSLEISLIENIQREELNPIEEA
ncbi:MAG: ParB/RepB/Spo0J family partition protein, partial [Candidatus Omnitrophota bacterium]